MCNLFSNTMPADAMRRLFRVAPERDRTGNQPPLPDIFPRSDAPIVRLDPAGERELVRMHWGFLVPQLSKRSGQPILPRAFNNARDDGLAASSLWRESFEQRRCLIPATSFCEPKGRGPAIYHWFALTGDEPRPPFAFAGLWRRFRGRYRDGPVDIATFAMVTTSANDLVHPIHPDRMPAILGPDEHDTWLAGTPREARQLLRPYPAERMRIVRSGEDEKADG